MRPLLWFVLGAACAFSQPVSFGVKGGIPLTNFVSAVDSGSFNFSSSTNRYIIGPTIELRLPAGLGIEFDALYRRLHYSGSGILSGNTFSTTNTTGNLWEFPLLLKYRFPSEVVRPYVDAGVSWDTLTGLQQTVSNTVNKITNDNPAELHRNTTYGIVAGVGLDIHILLHISPEIRYTRWNSRNLQDALGLLQSRQDQAEFLVGITF